MTKRKILTKLKEYIKNREELELSSILPRHIIVTEEDNSINISDKAIKLLGGNPDDYEDNIPIPELKHKLVANKKAYITDPILFTKDMKYRAYPDYKIDIITFF